MENSLPVSSTPRLVHRADYVWRCVLGVSLHVSGLAPVLERRLGTRQTLGYLFQIQHLLCGRLSRNRRSTRISTEPGRIEPRRASEVSHIVAGFTLPVTVPHSQQRSPPALPPPYRIVRWSPTHFSLSRRTVPVPPNRWECLAIFKPRDRLFMQAAPSLVSAQ